MSKQDLSVADFAPYFHAKRSAIFEDFPIMQSIYELRYQVYCVECGFLSRDDYPEGRESDEFDADSEHFCAHNLRNELVGYVRLVPADAHTGRFPWQRFCPDLIPGVVTPPADEAAEISRLMVR